MQKFIHPDMTAEDRANLLEAMADEVLENYRYSRDLTAEELENLFREHAEQSVALSRLQEQLDAIRKEYAEKMKPIREEFNAMIEQLKTGRIQEAGTCYKLVDEEERVVNVYTAYGLLIEQRPAYGRDLQRNIFRDLRPEQPADVQVQVIKKRFKK